MSSRLDEILDTLQQNSADQVAIATRGGHTRFPEVKAEAKAEIKSLTLDLVTEVFDEDEEIVQIFRKKLEEL